MTMAEKGTHESNEEDEDIKPNITTDEVKEILKKFYGLEGGELRKLVGYDDLNYHYIPKVNNNPFIKGLWPHGYVLKILNSLDSKTNDFCEAQNMMMLFLRENNIPSPVPVKSVLGQYFVRETFPQHETNKGIQKEHLVRLLEFQPGTTLKSIPKSYSMFYQLGTFLAKLNEVLKKFYHDVYETRYSIWQLNRVPQLKPYLHFIDSPKKRDLVEEIIEDFNAKVLSKANAFEKGIIHGDFNEHNILLSKSENGGWEISAILDFGDSQESYYLFELAISLCYMMIECKRQNLDPIIGAGHFLAGYLTIRPTFVVDYYLLKICICSRICQSLVLGLRTFILHPENSYVLDSQSMGWSLVKELWETPTEKIMETWKYLSRSYSLQNHQHDFQNNNII